MNINKPNIKNLIFSNSLIIILSLLISIKWKNKKFVNICTLFIFLVFITSVSITLSHKKHKSV
jgi:hypothetical protein